MVGWWNGAFDVKWLNIGNLWGRIEIDKKSPLCKVTYGMCSIGAGYGLQLQKSRFPDQPTQVIDLPFTV